MQHIKDQSQTFNVLVEDVNGGKNFVWIIIHCAGPQISGPELFKNELLLPGKFMLKIFYGSTHVAFGSYELSIKKK